MPELRQNIITRDWVIIASERAKRPDQFIREKKTVARPSFESTCPFCPGNESRTTPERWRMGTPEKWELRVVANLYPALAEEGEKKRNINGIYRSLSAVGFHDVIIEHPDHSSTVALYSTEAMNNLIAAYVRRYREIEEDERIESIVIFRNHGEGAGTSLIHPHSQVVATPVVPFPVRSRIDIARQYFDDQGECIFCVTLNDEIQSGERIIAETEHFIAFIPYAALSPFHIWIFPKKHSPSFGCLTESEATGLGSILQNVLRKLSTGLNDPDYNFTIRSIPVRESGKEYFHWYLAVVPRIAVAAGFELGSGMYVSTAIPEESAAFLRNIK